MVNDEYKPSEVEKKWVAKWQEDKIYRAIDGDSRPKSYILIEFPYPSGERLHVGHARSYSCLDAVARLRRMKGYNVMYPIGWDAFGLPAENYAIKTGIHPSITTKANIDNARAQAISWGLSFDWDREVNTSSPEYYKWTQWIFIQLFKKGLAYKAEIPVNWCPSCKINLANEEVIDGECERCGSQTERRNQAQWLLRITEYADRLLGDLETVNYREDIKLQQVNWIGKKEGIKIKFEIKGAKKNFGVEVFTTRIDTIFGVTFVVVAPEVAAEWSEDGWKASSDVEDYIRTALNKSEEDRKKDEKQKTGVRTDLVAVNPANKQEVPVYVADYVLKDVGTGVVMGVPTYDERDGEFARRMNLPIPEFEPEDMAEITRKGKEEGWAEKAINYHLRDWVFSRQHYWGEPIPMIKCSECGWVPIPEEELPVRLPEVEKYQPTDTGESPLAAIIDWVQVKCPNCGREAKRETDTMPNWAGSSWYFLRYIDPVNDSTLAGAEKLAYWLPVDWYNGGMEHTTLHLLYSRFWHKFLFDLGVVPTTEPYAKRTSHGVVLGPDGKRMSKSRGNVINPDEVVKKYGADTLRLYEMFMGPFDQTVIWSWESVEGVFRFIKRAFGLSLGEETGECLGEAKVRLGRLARKIESDIENMKYNTAVAALMEFLNWWSDNKTSVGKEGVEVFARIMAPMAPFLAEELHVLAGGSGSVHKQTWPDIETDGLGEGYATVAVQVNGRTRAVVQILAAEGQAEVERKALEQGNVARYVAGKKYRIVFVPGKIVNFVVDAG